MKIFSDLHHSGLYASFHYLFENRLGHELYRPLGLEWFEQGYWKIAEPYNNNIGTVKQFLESGFKPVDGTVPLNDRIQNPQLVMDYSHDILHKGVTLEEFLALDVDIIIASIPAHIHAYKKLIKDHNLRAKLIYHIGNIGWHNEIPWDDVDNVMASVKEFPVPNGKNVVFYRQEFNTSLFVSYGPTLNTSIVSFVNCLPQPLKWESLKEALPEYEFKAYGITCPDGIKNTVQDIANEMKKAKFGYHNKPAGDGFGHVIHNWMAAGKPVLVSLKDYKDKLAGELLIDGETCIDISDKDAAKIASRVRSISHLEYQEMCKKVRETFKKLVDYQADAQKVKRFIEKLV